MKLHLKINLKSLWNRRLTTCLTIFSIALSVSLFLLIEKTRQGTKDAFTQTISQTDLIVGARSGPMELLLYSIFQMGNPINNILFKTFESWQAHPEVEWAVPISLGDSHKGFRVIGTEASFFEHYHFRGQEQMELQGGDFFSQTFEVVLGHKVATDLNYQLGDEIILAHGIEKESFIKHDDKKFKIVGILKKTKTPFDRSLFINLSSMEALHIDWQDGAPPDAGKEIKKTQHDWNALIPQQITSFFLRTKTRIGMLRLQRDINTYEQEPLISIMPGVVLNNLWHTLGYAEDAMRFISFFAVIIGMMVMLVSLFATLQERRREMAIFRSVGAQAKDILMMFLLESLCLSILGIVIGIILTYSFLFLLYPWLENNFGIFIEIGFLSKVEYFYLGIFFVLGTLTGLIPSLRAYSQTLKDGLTIRN